MTKKEQIRELLSQGVPKAELVRRGFARSAVYRVGKQLAKDKNPASVAPSASYSESGPIAIPSSTTLSPDQEITDLQRQIQKVRLQAELDRVKGSVKTMEQLERELTLLRGWTIEMVCALGMAVERLSGNIVETAAFEAFEQQALEELVGHRG